jgi:hypothetical protein
MVTVKAAVKQAVKPSITHEPPEAKVNRDALLAEREALKAKQKELTAQLSAEFKRENGEVTFYQGHPILNLVMGNGKTLSMGKAKLKAIADNIELVKTFIASEYEQEQEV